MWYGLSKSEIEMLKHLNRSLIKRICGLPCSTPTAGLYLETGVLRIGAIIKAKGLLLYLVSLPKQEKLSKFFWCTQIGNDCQKLDIKLEVYDIGRYSQYKWNHWSRKKCNNLDLRN